MFQSSFRLNSLWGCLAVLGYCGSASAQWLTGGSGCNCSSASYAGPPPIMRQMAAAFGAAPPMTAAYAYDGAQCGAPIACHIEQPVQVQSVAAVQQQVVHVQALQPIVQPVMQTVQATEYRPVKQMVTKPVVTTEWVDQAVTVMTPVSEMKTQNVQTVDYQTVTEYKTVQKQVGYWVTKNIPTNKMTAMQYDNRPNMMGAMNRAGYNIRSAFTPPFKQVREFVPQTMTCTVPCRKQVAVPGMKQVTYRETKMQPMQTTRKVAVSKVVNQQVEVMVMQPYQVTKSVHVGSKVSFAHPGSIGTSATALTPEPDAKASAVAPRRPQTANSKNNNMEADQFNQDRRGSAVETADPYAPLLTEATVPARKVSTAAAKPASGPVRTSTWVAHNPASSKPQPNGKSAAISIADSAQ